MIEIKNLKSKITDLDITIIYNNISNILNAVYTTHNKAKIPLLMYNLREEVSRLNEYDKQQKIRVFKQQFKKKLTKEKYRENLLKIRKKKRNKRYEEIESLYRKEEEEKLKNGDKLIDNLLFYTLLYAINKNEIIKLFKDYYKARLVLG